jgi:hypothetical protein
MAGEAIEVAGGTRPARRRFVIIRAMERRRSPMWAAIALVLLVLWLLGAFAFKAAGMLIHVLLILAIIAVVMHFVRRSA